MAFGRGHGSEAGQTIGEYLAGRHPSPETLMPKRPAHRPQGGEPIAVRTLKSYNTSAIRRKFDKSFAGEKLTE